MKTKVLCLLGIACGWLACDPGVYLGNQNGLPLMDGGVAYSTSDPRFCTQMPALVAEASAKVGTCEFSDERRLPPLTEESCRGRLVSCSASDKQQLDLFLTCLRSLPPCRSASESGFSAQGKNCILLIASLSSACENAFLKP